MFSPDEKRKFSEHLEKYTENAYFLYFQTFNSHKGCHPCGTQYHAVYLGATANVLEELFKSMLREAYEFDIIIEQ